MPLTASCAWMRNRDPQSRAAKLVDRRRLVPGLCLRARSRLSPRPAQRAMACRQLHHMLRGHPSQRARHVAVARWGRDHGAITAHRGAHQRLPLRPLHACGLHGLDIPLGCNAYPAASQRGTYAGGEPVLTLRNTCDPAAATFRARRQRVSRSKMREECASRHAVGSWRGLLQPSRNSGAWGRADSATRSALRLRPPFTRMYMCLRMITGRGTFLS